MLVRLDRVQQLSKHLRLNHVSMCVFVCDMWLTEDSYVRRQRRERSSDGRRHLVLGRRPARHH